MKELRHPRSYERNRNYCRTLLEIVSTEGLCSRGACVQCPFHLSNDNSFNCYLMTVFDLTDSKYFIRKTHYSQMLLSLYSDAEKLTCLIQDI